MNQARQKVLYVITKSNWGGAQKYVYDLAVALPKDGFEVGVAFGGSGEKDAAPGELAKRLEEAHIRTIFIHAFARDVHLLEEFRAFFELIKIFKAERPDTVHLNSSKAGGLGALAARIAGVKNIVFTVHGLPEDEARNPLARTLIQMVTRITFALCHRIIFVSQNNFVRSGGHNAHLIYNGIRPIDFIEQRDARTRLLPPLQEKDHRDETWVITNAELHPNKNLFVAIDAIEMARKAGAHLFYCIMSPGQLREQLEAYIAHKNLETHVKLLGFVPDGARYLKAFDIFFLPSQKEGLPYVILEAGLASLPVVASDVGGIPEIISDGQTGCLCVPSDVDGFARVLTTLANDSELRQRLAVALNQKVQQDFSFDEMIKKTLALYS